jgi:hypothetical protein
MEVALNLLEIYIFLWNGEWESGIRYRFLLL